jgi:hypothetical protein
MVEKNHSAGYASAIIFASSMVTSLPCTCLIDFICDVFAKVGSEKKARMMKE